MAFTNKQIKSALLLLEKTRSVSQTIRILGYPSKTSLYNWAREYQDIHDRFYDNHPSGNEWMISNAQQRPLHPSTEVKLEILKRCFERGEKITAVSSETGYSRTSIYNWYWKYQKGGTIGLMRRRKKRDLQRKPSPDVPARVPESDSQLSELKALREKVFDMQMEIDLLKGTIDALKKDQGVGNEAPLTNREKAAIVDANRNKYPLGRLLAGIGLARSSYYHVRRKFAAPDKYQADRKIIGQIFKANYCCYGYRRVKAVLAGYGRLLSEKVVRRLMKEEGFIVRQRLRQKYSSYQGEITPAVPDLLQRDFRSESPNRKWVTDISEFAIPAGKVYLSVIVDCFDGLVVSSSLSSRPDALLVNETLDHAIRQHPESAGAILHSDRGAHYRWPGWIARTERFSLVRSMSRKSCSPDNAACEGFFGRMKNECFYRRNFKGYSIDDFKSYLSRYLLWYNESRIKKSLGYCSPMQFRARHGFSKA